MSARIEPNTDRTDASRGGESGWPLVAIVVLTWENYEETSDCLESLATILYPNYQVVVVDNNSTDGSYERLKREYDWCEFVRNESNLGVTRGNNVGIEYAMEQDVDYVLLLNDDTVAADRFLEPLVEAAESTPDAAIVGGVNYYESTGEIHNAGARFSTSLGGRTRVYETVRSEEPYPVGYVPTCLALVNTEFFREQGLLDESYFLGMEDVDLAWRARAAGKRVYVAPGSAVYHRLGSTSERSPFAVYHRTRNRLQFASKHLSGLHEIVFLGLFLGWTALSLGWWALQSNWSHVRAGILAMFDHRQDRSFCGYDELM
jgi:GT2 family glycosyltransferase